MPEQTSTSSQQRFRKRPVVIDAIQFDGSNYSAVFGFMAAALPAGTHSAEGSIFIPTLEGALHNYPRNGRTFWAGVDPAQRVGGRFSS